MLLANEEGADSIAAETKWRRCEHFSAPAGHSLRDRWGGPGGVNNAE